MLPSGETCRSSVLSELNLGSMLTISSACWCLRSSSSEVWLSIICIAKHQLCFLWVRGLQRGGKEQLQGKSGPVLDDAAIFDILLFHLIKQKIIEKRKKTISKLLHNQTNINPHTAGSSPVIKFCSCLDPRGEARCTLGRRYCHLCFSRLLLRNSLTITTIRRLSYFQSNYFDIIPTAYLLTPRRS